MPGRPAESARPAASAVPRPGGWRARREETSAGTPPAGNRLRSNPRHAGTTMSKPSPPGRAKPIPGLTEASELKSVGLSHSAAQTRTRGPAAPLTTRMLRPTHASKAEICAERNAAMRYGGRHLLSKYQRGPRRATMYRPESRTDGGDAVGH